MERFSSLKHAPAETRRLLRQRFAGFLPSGAGSVHRELDGALDDEAFLALLLDLHIKFESDVQAAQKTYSEASVQTAGSPSMQDLVADGWMRIIWGRISAQLDLGRAAASEVAMPGYKALMTVRHGESYRFSGAARARPELATLAETMERDNRIPAGVFSLTPEWVAARLWDRQEKEPNGAPAALRLWVDRWKAMGAPTVIPGQAWSTSDAKAFRDVSLDVLGSIAGLPGWDETRARIVSELAIVNKQPRSNVDPRVPAVPDTYIGRALWLEDPFLERSLMEALTGSSDVNGLLRILLADIEKTDLSQAPNELARLLLPIVLDRPDLFFMLVYTVRFHPLLLADLLFWPSTSALACLLVARWEPPHGAWDREQIARDFYHGKSSAFADAVSVMAYQLSQNTVLPAEVAALLEWLHSDSLGVTNRSFGSPQTLLAILKAELVQQSHEILTQIATALIACIPEAGMETPAFAAALDVIDNGDLVSTIEPASIVGSYVRGLNEVEFRLTARRVPQASAAALFALAMRLPADQTQRFLYPIDVKDRLAKGAAENPYTLADNIGRSVRTHIRILSRAISGMNGTPPDALIDALISILRTGALSHKEKGRVAAFTPRLAGAGGFSMPDVPIAADIGAALAALPEEKGEGVLAALLETDEPMVLAELVTLAPRKMRVSIVKRISEISPSEAGDIYSLPEAQARVDKLLAAGLSDAAALFIENERKLETLGKAPGRPLAQLHADLRLLLLRSDWDGLAKVQVPANLSQDDQSAAADTISFFQAIAALKKPGGDLSGAEYTFSHLANRRPDIDAYAVNRLAARISLLLTNNGFGVLSGTELARGRQLLTEAEQLAARVKGQPDRETVAGNHVLLLLATGQPDAALAILASINSDSMGDTIAAYSAVALSRVGRIEEATAALSAAEDEFGTTDILKAAREHISTGAAFRDFATTSSDDDPGTRVKLALMDFRQMDHMRQAETLSSEPEPFDAVTIDHVRSAGGSIVALMPMMKSVARDSTEDDLTALVQRVLEARIEFLGWHVADQSKGGFTANGNPGERDLVIRKGSTVLAVIEAVVCDRPVTTQWTRNELTSHFQKLLAYDTCRLFFHVTYAWIDNPASITALLKAEVAENTPKGFTFISSEEIPITDSRPTGLIARYKGEFGEVKVVFLILNLAQHVQKDAAKLADSNSARKPKDGHRAHNSLT